MSEKKDRLERKTILADYLEARKITAVERNVKNYDSIGGSVETTASVIHVEDLHKFLKDFLDGYKKMPNLFGKMACQIMRYG